MKTTPICLFTYNRPDHTKQTINALAKNNLASQSELFVFSDGPKSEQDLKKVQEVRKIINNISGFKSVKLIVQEENKGLADSIMDGVSDITDQYERAIIVEDDLITSPYFLTYMNKALELYADEEQVMHISGYMFPIKVNLPQTFFVNIATCWGWATWQRAWKNLERDPQVLLDELVKANLVKKFTLDYSTSWLKHLKANIDGTMNTWAVRWHASFFLKNGFCLHPGKSLVENIGLDGSGTNCTSNNKSKYSQTLADEIEVKKIPLIESKKAIRHLKKFFKPSIIKILKHKIHKIL